MKVINITSETFTTCEEIISAASPGAIGIFHDFFGPEEHISRIDEMPEDIRGYDFMGAEVIIEDDHEVWNIRYIRPEDITPNEDDDWEGIERVKSLILEMEQEDEEKEYSLAF